MVISWEALFLGPTDCGGNMGSAAQESSCSAAFVLVLPGDQAAQSGTQGARRPSDAHRPPARPVARDTTPGLRPQPL